MVELTAPKVATRAITSVSNKTPSAIRNEGGPSFGQMSHSPVLSKVEQSKIIDVNVDGLGVVPKQLQKVALDIYAKAQQQASDAEFFEATVKKDEWVAKNITDPMTGIRQHRGKDTLKLADSVGTSYQAFSDDTREGLSERNKRRWDLMSESTRVKIGGVVMNHTAKELDNYRRVTGQALMESTMRRGERDIGDLGASVPVGLGVLQGELAAKGIDIKSPAGLIAVEDFYDEIIGRATKGQMMGTPTSADITLATKTLDKYSSGMSANAVGKIRKDLKKSFEIAMIGESVASIVGGRTPSDKTEAMDMAGLADEVANITPDIVIQNKIRREVNSRNDQRNLGINNARSIAENNYYEIMDSGGNINEADKALEGISVSDGLDIKSKYQTRLRIAIADETKTQEVVAAVVMKGAVEHITALANKAVTTSEAIAWIGGQRGLSEVQKRELRDKFLKLTSFDESVSLAASTATAAEKAVAKATTQRISVNYALSHQNMLVPDKITGIAPFEENKRDYNVSDYAMLKEISANGDPSGEIRTGINLINDLFHSDAEGNPLSAIPDDLEFDYRKMVDGFVAAKNTGDPNSLKTLKEKIKIINDEKYSWFNSDLSPSLLKDLNVELSVASFADAGVDGGESALAAFASRSDAIGEPIRHAATGQFFIRMTGNRIAIINSDGNVEVLAPRRR